MHSIFQKASPEEWHKLEILSKMEQIGQKVSIDGKYTQLQAVNYPVDTKEGWHLLFLTL